MRELRLHNSDSSINRFWEIGIIQQQVEIVGSNINSSDISGIQLKVKPNLPISAIKISGLTEGEVLQANRKSNRNVIFFHLGFFTIRVLPKKSKLNLLRLFF